MSAQLARMGWNPDSPTAEVRVSLLAYLRARYQRTEGASLAELEDLKRWIAWLDGDAVSIAPRQGAATLAMQAEIDRRIPPREDPSTALDLLTPIEAALLGGYVGEALDDLAASALPESAKALSRATAAKALAAIARVTRRAP